LKNLLRAKLTCMSFPWEEGRLRGTGKARYSQRLDNLELEEETRVDRCGQSRPFKVQRLLFKEGRWEGGEGIGVDGNLDF
jgi:hypothetical protein